MSVLADAAARVVEWYENYWPARNGRVAEIEALIDVLAAPHGPSIADLPAIVAEIREHAALIGYDFGALIITVYHDGCGSIIGSRGPACGGMFIPLETAIAQLRVWLTGDEIATNNLTLGLTADGKLIPASAEHAL